ncbi:alpha/beta hydrolase [Lacibacter sp. H375]|uniref:alpha/beta fold hydrolase n=1 Tax=Lacibacter sp. H375 TaxID=3133424 RepID=UPI0030C3FF20
MLKKTLTINGTKLCYLEKNESKSSVLFFIHGNSSSSYIWDKQLQSPLFNNHHMIAIDLPGHGDSDVYADYNPIDLAKILAKAIGELTATKPYILIGFSYGANLIAEVLTYRLQPVGMVFSGACIVGGNFDPLKILLDIPANIYLQEQVSSETARLFFDKHLATSEQIDKEQYLTDFFRTQTGVRQSIIESAVNGNYTDEFLSLASQKTQLLFLFGTKDKLVDINYLDNAALPFWRKTVVKIEGAGHFIQTDMPESFNQILSEYASEQFKATHSSTQNE